MSQERKGKFGIAPLLLLAGSVMVMVSQSLVWFRGDIFGVDASIKGSELAVVSEFFTLAGESLFARGEYVVAAGALALVLTLVWFFAPAVRKLLAAVIAIAAVVALATGIEATAKLVGDGLGLAEGIYILFVGSILLLIGAIKWPPGVRAEAYPEEVPPATAQTYESAEEPLSSATSQAEPETVNLPPTGIKPPETTPRPAPGVDEVTANRNRLVVVAIGLVILAIFSSVAFRLPEADTYLAGGLFVGHVIKLVIAAIMLSMVIPARPRLAAVVTYYGRRAFKVEQDPARAKVVANIDGLSGELANIVIIAIVWPIVAQMVNVLLFLDVERGLRWISIIVTLGFVALLLYRLYKGYQLLGPVLGVTGKAAQEVSCPKCGTLNRVGTKFCTSCGAELQLAPAKEVKPVSLHCSKCGVENSPDAKFCQSCGAPLSKEVKKRTRRSSSKNRSS